MQTPPVTLTARSAPVMRPIGASERSEAPDLARGGVLLGIALANVSLYIYGVELGTGHRPVDSSSLDRASDFVVTLLVNERSRPMFALLFGFGLATMARRMTERGMAPRARTAVLLRRNLWLIGFGFVHAALLFEGDILGIYGATGLVVLLLMNRRPRVMIAWGAFSVLTLALLYGSVGLFAEALEGAATTSYLAAVTGRVPLFLFGVVAAAVLLFMLAPMLLGVVVARAGWLDRPWEHVALLRRTATVGLAVGLVGGLPYALVVARVWDPGAAASAALSAVHAVTGILMGVAYVSLFALWAARRRPAAAGTRSPASRSGVAGALQAVGERSLTSYLLQSLMLAPLLAPWGFGVGERLGTAAAYGIATAVWLVTVALAWAMAGLGLRGPFEVLLRRLTYAGDPKPELIPAATIERDDDNAMQGRVGARTGTHPDASTGT